MLIISPSLFHSILARAQTDHHHRRRCVSPRRIYPLHPATSPTNIRSRSNSSTSLFHHRLRSRRRSLSKQEEIPAPPRHLTPRDISTMGRPPNLYAFDSVDDGLAPSLRRYVLEQQNEALKRHGVFRVAVSGGSLPKTLAAALLAPGSGSEDDQLHFGQWEIFYADERCVPLDHDDSNHRLVKQELLDRIPAELGQPKVFPVDEKYLDDEQEMADQYEKVLVSIFAARDSVKLPLFDLILLGCGPDGHTCSLFPDHPLLREQDAWVLSIDDSPKPPPKRITLSLPVVQHGAKIAFVATGASKQSIMKQIFETEEGSKLPCGLVNAGAGEKVSWFCDTAAVEGVSFPRRESVM